VNEFMFFQCQKQFTPKTYTNLSCVILDIMSLIYVVHSYIFINFINTNANISIHRKSAFNVPVMGSRV
jgi:hypothetical protein